LDIASMASDVISKFSDALNYLQPDIIFLLGDRAEIFSVAQVAAYLRIPIAHYFGGDNASGTYDNFFRHCITKLSALHFVSSEESKKRVLQLGEDEGRVFQVGSTAVENIRSNITKDQYLLESLGIRKNGFIFLITYHPLTLDLYESFEGLRTLLAALKTFSNKNNSTLVFTAANADEGGDEINNLIKFFVAESSDFYFYESLGMKNYLNLMSRADVVIGNSSSGVYEAPILSVPSVDIGNRQKGRFPSLRSVIRTPATEEGILEAITSALAMDTSSIAHCFGDGDSAEKIISILEEVDDFDQLISKSFHDIF